MNIGADDNISDKIYLQNILENLPEYIYWKDKNLIYKGCNKHVAEYLGLRSPKDIVGKTDYSFGWDEVRIRDLHEIDMQIIKTGREVIVEEIIPKSDGSQRIMLTSKSPLYCEANNIVGILGVSADITKLKALEEKLRNAEASEARFKAMSALGGMIAHELRTPLTSLGMSVYAIEQLLPQLIAGYEKSVDLGKTEAIRPHRLELLKQSIANMGRSVKYADTTITTVLAGLHYSDSNAQVEAAPFSLKQMVVKAIAEYPFNADENHLCKIKHIDDVTVLGQELMVMHVLHNLIKNALHVIDAERRGEITIWSDLEKNMVNLHVEDTAKGIAPMALPHIFEAFYTTKKQTAVSIGLGLYFCKMVLRKMEGDITCESELGKYTRFKITLPLQG